MSGIQIKKTIIYRQQKPLLVFIKRETINLRTKSAPPIRSDENVKKFVLKRADGTLIKLEDLELSDDDTSSDEEDKQANKKSIINQIRVSKCTVCKEVRTQMLNTLIKNKTHDNTSHKSGEFIQTKPSDSPIYKPMENTVYKPIYIEPKIENHSYTNVQKSSVDNIQIHHNLNINHHNKTSSKSIINSNTYNSKYSETKPKNESVEKKKNLYSSIYTPPKISDVKIVFSLQQIYNCKEEKPITFKLLNKPKKIKVSENYSDFVVKNETVKDKALFELNKLTRNNIKKIISNLRNLEISKTDAKSIGSLIVFKAINEPQFCKQYAEVVCELKNFRSKQEKDTTIFFSTVIRDILAVLEKNINWEDTASSLKRENYKSSGAYERAYEEEEIKRYAMKKHTLGAIDFICNLYLFNVVEFTKIKSLIDFYRKTPSQDVIEVICKFIKNVGDKFDKYERKYLQELLDWLDSEKDRYDHRIKFMIQDVFEKRGAIFSDVKKDLKIITSPKNNFIELEQESKNNYYIEIQDIKSIYEDLLDENDEEDELLITDNFMMGSDNHGRIPFFTAYLFNCITNKKRSTVLIPFIVKYYDSTNLTKSELIKILEMFKDDLKDLVIEAPVSEKNYTYLITLLRQKDIINQNEYSKLKSENFLEIIRNLNVEMSNEFIKENKLN